MYRDNSTLHNVIEISYSGLGTEEQLVVSLLEAHQQSLAAAGVTLRETQRGAVAGRVILTVGPGAEIHGARLVAWLERELAAANPGTEIYVHPYSLPRPLFFELPAEAVEARRQLLEAARSQPLPALTARPAVAFA
ncbi:MAG TPA: hypothetical protein VH988_04840 [Thermoanaerobaculia bacterium]|jgi:hypothetical protein|nr:hypothetical protein [Thermoanaerobaculia bacterium]